MEMSFSQPLGQVGNICMYSGGLLASEDVSDSRVCFEVQFVVGGWWVTFDVFDGVLGIGYRSDGQEPWSIVGSVEPGDVPEIHVCVGDWSGDGLLGGKGGCKEFGGVPRDVG